MSSQKRILLLGSGLMTVSVIDYLLKRPENYIIVASNILEDAKKVIEGKRNCEAVLCDATKVEQLDPLVQKCDIVISYLPYVMHPLVAPSCLRNNKNLVTASYISDYMRGLDEQAKNKNLIFLNEVGVDPGIDHIATMKVVHECQNKGEKQIFFSKVKRIIEYESWCGGLPSPEFCDNPLGWSPIGAFLALNNNAKYLKDNQVIDVEGKDLLYHAKPLQVNQLLLLDGYPNRNSVELYSLHDCNSIIRGTLRCSGFSAQINALKSVGLFNNEQKPKLNQFWFSYMNEQLQNEQLDNDLTQNFQQELDLDQEIFQIASKLVNRTFKHPLYFQIEKATKLLMAKTIINGLRDLGLFSKELHLDNGKTYIQNLVDLLKPKLDLQKGETDMLVMQHRFKIQRKNGSFYRLKSTLIGIGEKQGFSSMAKLVGYPTGVSVQLILDGKIQDKGVHMPNQPGIFMPLYDALAKIGIQCKETCEELSQPSPKL